MKAEYLALVSTPSVQGIAATSLSRGRFDHVATCLCRTVAIPDSIFKQELDGCRAGASEHPSATLLRHSAMRLGSLGRVRDEDFQPCDRSNPSLPKLKL